VIRITPGIVLHPGEIRLQFVRSPGPGGQKVNKTATAVELRFQVLDSPSLSEEVRARLLRLAGSRATGSGEIVIQASRFRTQAGNRRDALERLAALIRQAAKPPKPRVKTRPPAAAKRERVDTKVRRARTKRSRRRLSPGEAELL